jgi:hypothetical protein
MLKTVAISANKKTGPIAVTYRAGEHETYGTCPRSCALHPKSDTGTDHIDADYLAAVYDSVPRRGMAWAYSHFPAEALPIPAPGKTTINASCDTIADAVRTVELGRPAVYAAPVDTAESWPRKIHGVTFARCPAELAESFTCADCGNGSPLCARGERDFVVVFVAHGTGKNRVGTDNRPLFNGTARAKPATRTTRKPCGTLPGPCPLARCCGTISRAILGARWPHDPNIRGAAVAFYWVAA